MTKKILFIVLLSFISCKNNNSKTYEKLNSAVWITGFWQNKTDTGTLSEDWHKLNDSVMKGTSFFVKGKDTLHHESMIIEEKEDELYYISTIKGQNQDKAVSFSLISSDEEGFVFENSQNEYPKKIIYKPVSDNNFVIYLEGILFEKPYKEQYSMTRHK